jgi:hypothetical protein
MNRKRKLSLSAAAAITGAVAAALLVPAPASAWTIVGDTYYDVVWEKSIWTGGEKWYATCPEEFPWLHKGFGTKGRHVGKGVVVSESPLIVNWDNNATFKLTPGDPENGEYSKHGVTAISGDVVNLLPAPISVKIEMRCTSNPDEAWIWGE